MRPEPRSARSRHQKKGSTARGQRVAPSETVDEGMEQEAGMGDTPPAVTLLGTLWTPSTILKLGMLG